jgi:hypothetical protein
MTIFDVHASIWRKSRRSIGNGNCVHVAASPDTVMVRDSADFASPIIGFPEGAWRAFVAITKAAKLRGS